MQNTKKTMGSHKNLYRSLIWGCSLEREHAPLFLYHTRLHALNMKGVPCQGKPSGIAPFSYVDKDMDHFPTTLACRWGGLLESGSLYIWGLLTLKVASRFWKAPHSQTQHLPGKGCREEPFVLLNMETRCTHNIGDMWSGMAQEEVQLSCMLR